MRSQTHHMFMLRRKMESSPTMQRYQSSNQPRQQMNVARNVLEELKAERNALDPSFIHCVRLLDTGISMTLLF